MGIKVIKPGLLSTIQDQGRMGQMHNGIAQTGAMDRLSMHLANWLVGNPLNHPTIEVTVIGPSLQFEEDISIAVSGADFDLYLDGSSVAANQTIQVKAGQTLTFDHCKRGARAYIAMSADFDIPAVLTSYSTNLIAGFGGIDGKELAMNQMIALKNVRQVKTRVVPAQYNLTLSGKYLLRCTWSVETGLFSDATREQFFSRQFTVSPDSNRMGIRFKGQPIDTSEISQIISSGLTPGSIQLPPSGLPIISSVDGQTIGGYPRIANVISADLPLLGQLRANDKIRFCLLSQEQATEGLRRKQALLNQIFSDKQAASPKPHD